MSRPVLHGMSDLPPVDRCLSDSDIRIGEAARQEMVLLSQGPIQAILVIAYPLSQAGRNQVRDLRTRASQAGYAIRVEFEASPGLIADIYRHFTAPAGAGEDEPGNVRTDASNSFDSLVFFAGDLGASDIHILLRGAASEHPFEIQFRIHGELDRIDLDAEWTLDRIRELCVVAYTVLANNKDTTWDPSRRQDANIARQIGRRMYRVRYAHHPIYPEGVHIVLRLLSTGRGVQFAPSLQHLGYSDAQAAAIEAMVAEPSGLIILSGETGSGKSTTLANLMHILLQAAGGTISLQTVEDPPEYEVPGVIQSPVIHRRDDQERGVNPFVDAIVGAMRCDPDILVVGEIRDIDTALLAMAMAESGHPVLGTLHARRALGIIPRLEIMGATLPANPISRAILCAPGYLAGLIHQALLPVLCDYCARPYVEECAASRIDPGLDARVRAVAGRAMARLRVRGPGCGHCRNGVRGRTVCAEVVIPDAKLLQLLGERRDQEAFDHWLGAGGGFSYRDHAIQKMCEGLIAPADVEANLGRLRHEVKRLKLKAAGKRVMELRQSTAEDSDG